MRSGENNKCECVGLTKNYSGKEAAFRQDYKGNGRLSGESVLSLGRDVLLDMGLMFVGLEIGWSIRLLSAGGESSAEVTNGHLRTSSLPSAT